MWAPRPINRGRVYMHTSGAMADFTGDGIIIVNEWIDHVGKQAAAELGAKLEKIGYRPQPRESGSTIVAYVWDRQETEPEVDPNA